MNKYMGGEDKRNQKSKRDELRRSNGRRRMLSMAALLVVILSVGMVVKFLFFSDSKDDQKVFIDAETGQEDVVKEVPPFIRGVEENMSVPETKPVKINLHRIKAGTNHSLFASDYAHDTQKVKEWIKGKVPYEGEKIAFLTFDDGPVGNTYKVLDILKRRGVPGTFFIPGKTLEDHNDKEVLHRYIEEGHGIAIHSYSHDYAYLYPGKVADPGRITEEYDRTLKLMRETLGDDFDTKVFRFPGGAGSWKNIPEAEEALGNLGVSDIDWNAISGDSEPSSRRPDGPTAMADYVMETLSDQAVQDVAVVLMHDFKGITIEYLDQVIDQFIEAGYTFGILE